MEVNKAQNDTNIHQSRGIQTFPRQSPNSQVCFVLFFLEKKNPVVLLSLFKIKT